MVVELEPELLISGDEFRQIENISYQLSCPSVDFMGIVLTVALWIPSQWGFSFDSLT